MQKKSVVTGMLVIKPNKQINNNQTKKEIMLNIIIGGGILIKIQDHDERAVREKHVYWYKSMTYLKSQYFFVFLQQILFYFIFLCFIFF